MPGIKPWPIGTSPKINTKYTTSCGGSLDIICISIVLICKPGWGASSSNTILYNNLHNITV
jgi:hypothetical protein